MLKIILEIYSWNVNTNTAISQKTISKLLKNTVYPHVIIFSVQEMISQFYGKGIEKTQEYINIIQQELMFKYSLVQSSVMNGIALIVFKKNELSAVFSVKQGKIGAGLAGVYGNKGAVALGLEFEVDSRFCSLAIVGAHLDPHQGNFKKRNATANYIFSSLLLRGEDARLVHDYDVIFIAGDLNYRLISHDREKVKALLDSNNIQGLVEMDELKLNSGPWDSWKEGQIGFLPTYKYRKELEQGKVSSHFSQSRIPAYTDRILFKSLKSDVKVLMYDSVPGVGFSDHQPVYGRFSVDFDSPAFRDDARMSSKDLYYRYYWYKIIRILEINWMFWTLMLVYVIIRAFYA